jgi:homocysteine S-methyltransferase
VRAACALPAAALLTFGEDGRTFYGHRPADAYHALADAGADLVGTNCSVGPQGTLDVVTAFAAARAERLASGKSAPWIAALPNAGLPQLVGGRYAYMATPEYFANYARRFVEAGARLVGGCCGTTPEHVAAMRAQLGLAVPAPGGRRAADRAAPRPARRCPCPRRGRAHHPDEDPREVPGLGRARPPRGIAPEDPRRQLLAERGVDAINVADSPMARVRMSAQALTAWSCATASFETILHFTCRDRNLMGIQADLLGAHAMGLRTILALTGDPPSAGDTRT